MTPCEKLGYKVGDEFEVKVETGIFYKGQKITLSKDDGSRCPVFTCEPFGSKQKDGWGVVCLDRIRPLPITLRKGDYCSTANMTESEYHAVAAAFMAAGADEGEHPEPKYLESEVLEAFGWGFCNTLYHGREKGSFDGGRHLTPAQIIGAFNAKTPEQEQADVHIIKEVNEKLEKLRAAEHEYRKALAKLRNSLPNHAVVEMGGNPQQDAQPTKDLTDPGNWRAGDVVEYHGGGQPRSWYTIGKHYELKKQGGRLGVIDNDGDFMAQSVKAGRFTFVLRP